MTAPFVLLDDSRPASWAGALLFESPHRIIEARCPEEVDAALAALDQALDAGFWLAGWIGYEAAYAFEPKLGPAPALPDEPLVWLAVSDRPPRHLDPAAIEAVLAAMASGRPGRIGELVYDRDESAYVRDLECVQAHIAAGDVYQINLTFPGRFELTGHPASLYAAMRRAQPTAYSALIATGAHWVLSASPELFVRCRNQVLQAAPMKGTAHRHPSSAADRDAAEALRVDEKNRAENLMIVDLLRNDLSRIAEPGSVTVDSLFEVEAYPTVHQMISRISAGRRRGTTASDIVRALFPCGSITGAPKIRAMELIADIETAPRGIYTGAIGYFAPSGDFSLNVPIRTAIIGRSGAGRVHVGAGIVADSEPVSEYRESILKAAFLHRRSPDFALLETVRWTPGGGYYLFERHLARLADSAAYFGFRCEPNDIRRALERASRDFTTDARRVRLLLDRFGSVSIESGPLPDPGSQPVRLAISDWPVRRDNPFLYHKTTNRGVYDDQLSAAREGNGDIDDVILVNEAGQVTETTIGNIFLRHGDRLVTPAIACGLLAGNYRAQLLAEPPDGRTVEEAVITPADCRAADEIIVVNSLRGERRGILVA